MYLQTIKQTINLTKLKFKPSNTSILYHLAKYSASSKNFLESPLNLSIKGLNGDIIHNLELNSTSSTDLIELFRKSLLLQHTDISVKLYKQCCQELYHLITPQDRSGLLKLMIKSLKNANPKINHLQYNLKRPKLPLPNYTSEYLDWFIDDTIERNNRNCSIFSDLDWNLIFKGWSKDSKFIRLEIALNCILDCNYYNYELKYKGLKIVNGNQKLNRMMNHWNWSNIKLTNEIIDSLLLSRSKSDSIGIKSTIKLFWFFKNDLGFNPNPSIIIQALNRFYPSSNLFESKVNDFLKLNGNQDLNKNCLLCLVNCFQSREKFRESQNVLDYMIWELKIEPDQFALSYSIKNLFELSSEGEKINLESLLNQYKTEWNILPDNYCLSLIIEGYSSLGDSYLLEYWYSKLTKTYKIKPNVITYLNLIKAYSSLGEIDKVNELAQEYLSSPNLPIKQAPIKYLINFYGNLGQFDKVEELFEILKRSKNLEGLGIWRNLIRACINCRRIDKGAEWLVKSSKVEYLGEFNMSLIDLLEEAGWKRELLNNNNNNCWSDINQFKGFVDQMGEKPKA